MIEWIIISLIIFVAGATLIYKIIYRKLIQQKPDCCQSRCSCKSSNCHSCDTDKK